MVIRFDTLQEAFSDPRLARYNKYNFFRTSSEQDLRMLQTANDILYNNYDPFHSNCSGFSVAVLHGGRVPLSSEGFFHMPNPTFRMLKETNNASGVWPPAPEPEMVP